MIDSIHDIRHLLGLVPEVLPLVKEARLVEGAFPIDTPADTVLSALRLEHMLKVAHVPVDRDVYDRVSTAAALYGLSEQIKQAAESMLNAAQGFHKVASVQDQIADSEFAIENALASFMPNTSAIIKAAEHLVDNYGDMVKSAAVRRLGGGDEFDPVLAIAHIACRERETPGRGYGEIALAMTKKASFDQDEVRQICSTIREMDEVSGLNRRGFDIYGEAFITKAAAASALQVKVAGRNVPVESLMRLPIDRLLGDDVAQACAGGPQEFKAVVESLPLEQQQLLASRV